MSNGGSIKDCFNSYKVVLGALKDQIEQTLGGGLTDGFEEELLEELKELESDILRNENAELPTVPKVSCVCTPPKKWKKSSNYYYVV